MKDLHEIAANARKAFYQISVSTADQRNKVLLSLARLLKENKEAVFIANREDLDAAAAEDLAAPLLHRLLFGEEKLEQVVRGLYAPLHRSVLSVSSLKAVPMRLFRFHPCV